MEEPYPGCRGIIRLAYLKKGVPETAIEVLTSSLADSTLKQYNITYKKWWTYCKNTGVFHAGPNKIIDFLNEKLKKGGNYNTINQHRSALNTLLQTSDLQTCSASRAHHKPKSPNTYKIRLSNIVYLMTELKLS